MLFLIDTVDIGGATKLTFDLINCMEKNDLDFKILYLNPQKFEGENLLNYFDFEKKADLLWYPRFRIIRRLVYMYKNFRKYDLVHSCMEQSNFYSSLVRWIPFSSFKLIITYHGLDSVYIEGGTLEKFGVLKKFYYLIVMKNFQNFLYKKVDSFIAVCEAIKKYLVDLRGVDPDKIKVRYHGIILKNINENIDSKNIKDITRKDKIYTIGYIGRLGYSKGLEGLMEIIPGLIDADKTIRIKIKGDGELSEYLKLKAKEYSIEDYVSFENFDKNVYEFYKKIDLLVLPSFYETTNLTVLEAMYYGTLVLSSDAGGLPEVVDNNANGFTFQSENFNELSKNILKVKKLDPSDIERIKKNALNTVQSKFNLTINSKSIYKELISASKN